MEALLSSAYVTLGLGAMCAVLLVLVIVLFIMVNREAKRRIALEERLDRLMRDGDGDSIEDMVSQVFRENDELQQMQSANYQDIKELQQRLHTVIQKVGIVKYDAFQQMGGNLSSAIAMLDQDDNGFIINTVQSVDGCYSYVKSIRHGHPDVAFGKEEEEAVEIAKSGGTPSDTVYIGDTNSPKEKSERTERRPVRKTQPSRPAQGQQKASSEEAARRRPVKKAPPSQQPSRRPAPKPVTQQRPQARPQPQQRPKPQPQPQPQEEEDDGYYYDDLDT
jgi:tetrahydromethanopterin S-methyltransferase subunit G